MKRYISRIIAIVLVLVLCLPLMTSCDLFAKKVAKDPYTALKDAQDVTEKAMTSSVNSEFAKAALNGFTFESSMELSDLLGTILGAKLENKVGLSLTGYCDLKTNAYAAILSAAVNGKSIVDLNGFATKDAIIFNSPELLGSSSYGIKSTDLNKLLPVGSSNAVVSPEFGEKLSKLVDKYKDILLTDLFAAATTTRTEDTVTINEKPVEAVIFVSSLDRTQLLGYITGICEKLKSDEDVKAVIDEIAKVNDDVTAEDIYEMIDELVKEVKEANDELTTYDRTYALRLGFIYNAKSRNLMKLEADFIDNSGDIMRIDLTFGIEVLASDFFELTIAYQGQRISLISKVVEENENGSKSLTVLNIDGTIITVETNLQKDGDYTIDITLPDNPADIAAVTLKGKLSVTKTELSMSVDSVAVKPSVGLSGFSISVDINLKVVVRAGTAGMPTAPTDYADISDEAVRDALLSSMSEAFAGIIEMLPDELRMLFQ